MQSHDESPKMTEEQPTAPDNVLFPAGRCSGSLIIFTDDPKYSRRPPSRSSLRAGLVARAEDWPWSSLAAWGQPALWPFLDPGPVSRPAHWVAYVDRPETEAEPARLRYSAWRQAPFGSDSWARRTATTLGLESSLRTAGWPRRPAPDSAQPSLFPAES